MLRSECCECSRCPHRRKVLNWKSHPMIRGGRGRNRKLEAIQRISQVYLVPSDCICSQIDSTSSSNAPLLESVDCRETDLIKSIFSFAKVSRFAGQEHDKCSPHYWRRMWRKWENRPLPSLPAFQVHWISVQEIRSIRLVPPERTISHRTEDASGHGKLNLPTVDGG